MYIRRDNRTIDRGDHLAMDVSSLRHPHTVMLLDHDDLVILQQKRYGRVSVNWNGSHSMRSATVYDRKQKTMRHVSHVLLRRPRWMKIDHANGNPLDNRRANLEKRG
jgi:hypothetical protein